MLRRPVLHLVVLCLLIGMLPPAAVPLPSASVVSAAPLASPMLTPPPLPALPLAQSAGLSATTAEQFRQQYEISHTLRLGFDGSFSVPRRPSHTVPDIHLNNGTTNVSHLIQVPAGLLDSIDLTVSTETIINDNPTLETPNVPATTATLGVKPVGSSSWTGYLNIVSSQGTILASNSKRITLGWTVPPQTMVEVWLFC